MLLTDCPSISARPHPLTSVPLLSDILLQSNQIVLLPLPSYYFFCCRGSPKVVHQPTRQLARRTFFGFHGIAYTEFSRERTDDMPSTGER